MAKLLNVFMGPQPVGVTVCGDDDYVLYAAYDDGHLYVWSPYKYEWVEITTLTVPTER